MRPPKKSWKKIFNLSGGEKTLSSLALVFALHHFKPTPLYFMDEIDAALDFKNVSIVACYIYVSTASSGGGGVRVVLGPGGFPPGSITCGPCIVQEFAHTKCVSNCLCEQRCSCSVLLLSTDPSVRLYCVMQDWSYRAILGNHLLLIVGVKLSIKPSFTAGSESVFCFEAVWLDRG